MSDVITYWNRGAEQLYGWTREQALDKVSHQLTQTIFPAPLEEINTELLRTGRWEGELIHTKRDGTPVVVVSRWALQRDEQGLPAAILETNNDITDRKRAEAKLRESERRYRHIFQTVGVSIWEEDFSQVKTAIDELKAKGVSDFGQYLAAHSEFVQQAISAVKIIDVNEASVKLFAAQSKDELLGSLNKVFLPETRDVFARELVAIAEGRANFESENFLQTLAGDKLVVLFTITFPPPPASFDSVLVTITDVTERKRAEQALQNAQTELAHITRVTTLGEMTASIAHEINQPLAAVVTNGGACLRWLMGESPNLDEAREAARRVIRDGNRASEIISRIRALLRKTDTQKVRLDINEAIQEVVLLTQHEADRKGVNLRLELSAGLPPVFADRVQLQQVALNLLMNGVEAVASVNDRPRELVICSRTDKSGQVIVAVQDSGDGIDAENLEKIFDAFYTTKSQGMGMGLAISRSIVENHGGRLWAVQNEGPGATFQFALQPCGRQQ
jgi:PAS domain S-box-containing protein